jgi:hypothetical protein
MHKDLKNVSKHKKKNPKNPGIAIRSNLNSPFLSGILVFCSCLVQRVYAFVFSKNQWAQSD